MTCFYIDGNVQPFAPRPYLASQDLRIIESYCPERTQAYLQLEERQGVDLLGQVRWVEVHQSWARRVIELAHTQRELFRAELGCVQDELDQAHEQIDVLNGKIDELSAGGVDEA